MCEVKIAYLIEKKLWPIRLKKKGIKRENAAGSLSALVDSSLVETLASYDRA